MAAELECMPVFRFREVKELQYIEHDWRTRAKQAIGETPETLKNGVETLRNRILARKDLYSRTDDLFLLRFLRYCKFDCDKAFDLMLRYYKARAACPNWYMQDPLPDVQLMCQYKPFVVLKDRDHLGRRVMIGRMAVADPTEVTFEQAAQTMNYNAEAILEESDTQLAGMVTITDASICRWTLSWWLTPYNIKKSLEIIEECYPLETHAFHVVNNSWIFSFLYAILKPFLPDKIIKRVHVHGYNRASLHKYFDPAILPKAYGGQQPTFGDSEWEEVLFSRIDAFKATVASGFITKKDAD